MLVRYGLLLTTFLSWLAVDVDAKRVFSLQVKRVKERTGADQLPGNTPSRPRSRSPTRRRRLSLMDRPYSGQLGMRNRFEYETTISIGTPGQDLLVQIDTGAPYTWVPLTSYNRRGRPIHETDNECYDYKRTETFETQNKKFNQTYGTNVVKGRWVKDKFALGSGINKMELNEKFEFGAVSDTFITRHGVLGLAFSPRGDEKKSIFGELVRQRLVEHPMFTVFLKRCSNGVEECSNAGTLTLGGADRTNCGPEIGTAPIVRGLTHWKFEISAISFRGHIERGNFVAVTDTGSSDIRLPSRLFDVFRRHIKAYKKKNPFGREYPFLYASCQDLLSIGLTINGQKYEIPHNELVFRWFKNECRVLVLEHVGSNEIVLGAPWVRSYCHVHNWAERQIGFAEPK